MEECHYQWLRQKFVEPEFLLQALHNGFHIHHLDEDHSNNDPNNLVLIFGKDHFKLHGRYPDMGDGSQKWEDVLADKRARLQKGERAFELRKTGMKWVDIAVQIESDQANTHHMARRFAILNGKKLPVFPRKKKSP